MVPSPTANLATKIVLLIDPVAIRLVIVALLTTFWCLLHSLLITRLLQSRLEGAWPGWRGFGRIIYILGSTLSFGLLFWYFESLPAREIWTSPGVES